MSTLGKIYTKEGNIGDLRLSGSTIFATPANTDITITPTGTGETLITNTTVTQNQSVVSKLWGDSNYVSVNTVQTLVGKTMVSTIIDSGTNIVRASKLACNDDANPIVISTASPPSTGQILTATSATTANWQTPLATFNDANFTLQNNGSLTRQAKFSCSQIPLATTNTFTLPSTTQTLVGYTETGTISGKTMTGSAGSVSVPTYSFSADATTGIFNVSTGQINFTSSGVKCFDITSNLFRLWNTAGTFGYSFQLPILTASSTITFPTTSVADSVVFAGTTQTLTSKTITDTASATRADRIAGNSSTSIIVDVSAAPVNGYALIATSATAASWKTGQSMIDIFQVTLANGNGTATGPFSGSNVYTAISNGSVVSTLAPASAFWTVPGSGTIVATYNGSTPRTIKVTWGISIAAGSVSTAFKIILAKNGSAVAMTESTAFVASATATMGMYINGQILPSISNGDTISCLIANTTSTTAITAVYQNLLIETYI
jgi:hypothetical protein